MTVSKTRPSQEPGSTASVKAPYQAPRLEVLGSLRSATRGGGSAGTDGGSGMIGMGPGNTMMSDRRAKEDIVRIGTHRLGLGVYTFRYRAAYRADYGSGRQVGFMADEVADRYPQAVARGADGLLRVDYGRLLH